MTTNVSTYVKYVNTFACQNYLHKIVVLSIQEVYIYKYQDTGWGGAGVLKACFQNMTLVSPLPETTHEQPYENRFFVALFDTTLHVHTTITILRHQIWETALSYILR